ncbi:hypothetical protein [Paraburkholderia saeva]|jgi:hypothetical protein|uniref:Uncharacterized protein n=1 Tax=Paraburkholderia saeva TaxID=2777537 RepID=A0A9N8RYB0_9BURK|nr:hypothetical protein [Paraburkholderia saeva]CAG4890248.1 hypothetical protein R70241_00996 [Paraburkholderia saeva]CAG4898365.1 hypothetical protein R52603_02447 [Paraburkholderia saeva]CAG4911608.1 hypothetical protein LMG31841_04083 [Paraburkholderia saeva]
MHVETLGPYQFELSARQFIHNGGWAAFAAISTIDDGADAPVDVLPLQQVVDNAIFESEAAAIAAAHQVVIALLKRPYPPAKPNLT